MPPPTPMCGRPTWWSAACRCCCPPTAPTADIDTLLARLDGIILTGSRSNVQPALYDGPPHAEGTPEDPTRDGVTLPLIRARGGRAACRCWRSAAACRNSTSPWAASCTSGCRTCPTASTIRRRCSPPRGAPGQGPRVRITPGGWLHRLAGTTEIAVNSLHNQGIDRLAPGLVAEAHRAGRHHRGGARGPSPPPASPSACSGTRNTTGDTDPFPARSSSSSATGPRLCRRQPLRAGRRRRRLKGHACPAEADSNSGSTFSFASARRQCVP